MRKWCYFFAVCIIGFGSQPRPLIALASESSPDHPDRESRVAKIVEGMSPEQRVGQLFIVTFDGPVASPEGSIDLLIRRYGIGGVILSAENDNFDDRGDVLIGTRALVTNLQQIAFQTPGPGTSEGAPIPIPTLGQDGYLPLLIGTTHQGGGAAYSALHTGLTAAPSAMAIGATWDVGEAGVMGEIAGFELNALGINLQLGLTLDVVENPRAGNPGDPGVRSLGGNPFWVGELSREYVIGVHRGSGGRVAFVGQSFPGLGSGDRETKFDVPTVNKSFDELLRVDLSPFIAVASSAPEDEAAVDVLMPAQGRYSAWQGAISTDTRPLGMDAAALGEVLSLAPFNDWRQQGGVIMSAPLGRRGVRRYYDPTGNTFPAFEIARDALLAGNDILFLDEYTLDPEEDQYETVVDTIDSFVRKYREDAAFAERVDNAVETIVRLKLRLYGDEITLANVLGDQVLDGVGTREGDVFSLARKSVTLLSPALSEVANRLPRPPARLDRIVIFTDSIVERQCSACAQNAYPDIDALENAIARLYGFSGSSQISSLDVFSFSFQELEEYLENVGFSATRVPTMEGAEESGTSPLNATAIPELTIRETLTSAKWLVFALGDQISEGIDDNALRRFLAEKPEMLIGRNVIVFSLSAPYYLDATEVGQLTAYYGLYGQSSAFIEVAARVLFQEITPHQAPPVAVESVSYDLRRQLQVEPEQLFSLSRVMPGEDPAEGEESPGTQAGEGAGAVATPGPADAAAEGSAILLQTSRLLDRNGHVVPDGTLVEFSASYLAEGGLTETFAQSATVQGLASATLVLERVGLVEISARAGDARAAPLQIDVRMSEGETLIQVQTITPTATTPPTALPTATPTSTPAPTATEASTEEPVAPAATVISTPAMPTEVAPTPVVGTVRTRPGPSAYLDPRDLLSGLLAMVVLAGISWSAARTRGLVPLLRARFRLLLYIAVGVWVGYDYYALQLPGAGLFVGLGGAAPALFAWTGGVVALLLGLFLPNAWRRGRVRDSGVGGAKGRDDRHQDQKSG